MNFMGEPIPYASTRALEVVLGALMLVCGVTLVAPGDTFSLPQYQLVKFFIGEDLGGAIFIVTGFLRMTGLWFNGTKTPTPVFRVIGCIVGAAFWTTLGLAILGAVTITEVYPLMMGIAFTLAIAEIYSALRCGADASYLRTFGNDKPKGRV